MSPLVARMGEIEDVWSAKATTVQPSLPSKIDNALLFSQSTRSLSLATRYAFDLIKADGHWCGELLSNVTITAEHVFFCQSLGLDLAVDTNLDGSWGIAPDHPGDVSTTAEAYLALKILGVLENFPAMSRARSFVIGAGGLAKVRIFTRIFFAQFGLFPWDAVPQLPAEFILMPSQSPANIYSLSSWARSTVIPLLIIRHHQPTYALPNGASTKNNFLDELWLDSEDKMVPYNSPFLDMWRNSFFEFTFGVIDKILYHLHGLRYFPLRGYARRQCVDWILERQEKAGDWAGIVQALILEGFTVEDERIRMAIEATERFAWRDHNGKRIQACVSPVWDTVLMTRALCDAGVDGQDKRLRQAVRWSKARQLLGPQGDWRVYNPKLAPGGFAFEYHNTWYPDIDDTAAAILAFISHNPQSVESTCVASAANWICGMQNSDGGWGAFDLNNDKLFLNKIPFSDMDSLCDPSTADVTGRILEAFGLMIHAACQEHIAPDLLNRITVASERAIAYLAKTQESTGAWYGRRGMNYVYGTSNALCGLAYFSQDDQLVQDMVASAILWLRMTQNPDGGWGEGPESYKDPKRCGCGPSTASQTAWAVMGLLTRRFPIDGATNRGVAYLVDSQTDTTGDGASWPETKYTGTGFPNHFYLGYTLYRHYFPMMALIREGDEIG